MARNWIPVSQAEAEQHKLYGRGGWLVLLIISVVLSVGKDVSAISNLAAQYGRTLGDFLAISHPFIIFLKVALWADVVMCCLVLLMYVGRAKFFRIGTIWLLLLPFPVSVITAMALQVEGAGSVMAQGFFTWILSFAGWATYLMRSKRVRVTFENTVLEIERAVLPKTDESTVGHAAPAPSVGMPKDRIASAAGNVASDPSAAPAVPRSPSPPAILHVPAPSQPPAPPPAAIGSIDEATKEKIWAFAFQEYDTDKRKPGLYAECFAAADGNEAVVKVAYLKRRVAELERVYVESLARKEQKAKEIRDEQERTIALAARQIEQERWRADAAAPRGRCPQCDDAIPMISQECPHCRALLDGSSAWRVIATEPSACARLLCTKLMSKRASTPSDLIYVVKACASDPVLKDMSFRGSPLLALAAQRGLAPEVEALLRLGANQLAPDSAGRLPRDLAQGYPEVQALFDRDWKAERTTEFSPFVG